jgi:hypothetical protein
MPFSHNGLTFHPRYEGKCGNYIKDNLAAFRPYINEKTLFWIVGSEPKSCIAGNTARGSALRPGGLIQAAALAEISE